MLNQREFFNSMACEWDEFCQHDEGKIKHILDKLDIKKGAKILDVGTGTGILIPFLVEKAGEKGEVTAIDISEKMLEIAKNKYGNKNLTFICDDVFNSDLPNSYFDFIFCYSVFPHFKDKQAAIEILGNLLNKNGKLIICHSQSREEINSFHKTVSEAVSQDDLPPIDVIKDYFETSGLETMMEIDNDEMFIVIAVNSK